MAFLLSPSEEAAGGVEEEEAEAELISLPMVAWLARGAGDGSFWSLSCLWRSVSMLLVCESGSVLLHVKTHCLLLMMQAASRLIDASIMVQKYRGGATQTVWSIY
jgi:hypothetical protein